FAEGEVRGDDDAGPLIKLADEVEQQLPSRAGERQITELVEHDQVEPRQLRRQGPAFADPGLLFEACHHPKISSPLYTGRIICRELSLGENFLLDLIDRKILRLLQRDSSLALAEIADAVGLSSSPCWKRIKR